MKNQKAVKYVFILLSLLISGVVIYFRNDLEKLGNLGYLGLFLISVLGNSTIIIPAPVMVTAFVGGSIYNPFAVGIITALGATIGELTGYLAGFGGSAIVAKNEKYERVKGWIKKRGFLTISVLAAIPNPLFDLAGIVSGVTHYPLHKFLTATFIGKAVKFLAVAYLGLISL